MRKVTVSVIVMVVLMGCATQAMGYGGIFLGIHGGFSAQKPSLEGVEFSTDTSFHYGIRLGIKFLMIAVEANYFQAAHNLEPKELLTFAWADKEVDYNYLGLNGKFFFPFLIFHPYITVGYGFYSADIKTIDKDKKKGFNGGLGLEVHLGDKFSLLGEVKYHTVNLNIEERDLRIGNWTLSGGFNYYF